MFSYGPCHMAEQKQGDQLEPTYSSSVRIPDVALRIHQKRWTIGRSDERGSGISMLVAQHDDDDTYKYKYLSPSLSIVINEDNVGVGATLFPRLLHFTLDMYLILLSVSRRYQVPISKSLVWHNQGMNPTLSIIRYVSRVKWSNPGKGVAPSPAPQCSSHWKGSLLVALNYGRQLLLYQY